MVGQLAFFPAKFGGNQCNQSSKFSWFKKLFDWFKKCLKQNSLHKKIARITQSSYWYMIFDNDLHAI